MPSDHGNSSPYVRLSGPLCFHPPPRPGPFQVSSVLLFSMLTYLLPPSLCGDSPWESSVLMPWAPLICSWGASPPHQRAVPSHCVSLPCFPTISTWLPCDWAPTPSRSGRVPECRNEQDVQSFSPRSCNLAEETDAFSISRTTYE